MINLKEMLIERQVNQSERLGCLMAMVDESTTKTLMEFSRKLITDDDLYHKIDDNGEDEFGREDECHITIRYGFTKDLNELDVRQLLKGHKECLVEITGLDIFDTNPEYDVVKFNIDSPVLTQLNTISGIYPNKTNFPDYHPHLTLAYVKKGTFPHKKKLQMEIPITSVCYSPISGAKSYFTLDMESVSETVESPKIDAKIEELELEWDRLDSIGTGVKRQHDITQEIARLKKIKEPREKLDPNSPKVKDMWASLHNQIK